MSDKVEEMIMGNWDALKALRYDLGVKFTPKILNCIKNKECDIVVTIRCDKQTFAKIDKLSEWAVNLNVLFYNHILRK